MRPLVWLRRIRHRCGYGIHSPFAYNLVTQVIYNDGEYYAYNPLRSRYRLRGRRAKIARLLFRLANNTQPCEITVPCCLPEAEQAYMQAGCRGAKIAVGDSPLVRMDNRLTILLDLPRHKATFDALKADAATTVTFDLYDLALVYHNLPLPRQDYIVNFEL